MLNNNISKSKCAISVFYMLTRCWGRGGVGGVQIEMQIEMILAKIHNFGFE